MRALIESRMSFLEAVDLVTDQLTEQDIEDPRSWAFKIGKWFAGSPDPEGKRFFPSTASREYAAAAARGQQRGQAWSGTLRSQTDLAKFAERVSEVEQSLHGKVDPVIEWARGVADGQFGTSDVGVRMPRWGRGAYTIQVKSKVPDQDVDPADKIDLIKKIVGRAEGLQLQDTLNAARGELEDLWQVLESVYGDAVAEVRHLENRWQQPVNQWGRMMREIEDAELSLASDPADADRMVDRAYQRLGQIVVQLLESQEELNFWFVQVQDLLEAVRLAGYTRATMPGPRR